MLGKLTAGETEQLLSSQVVGRIGCHYNGTTYVVPISYAYDGDSVYAHTGEGMKLDMMRKNPNVCFEVDNLQDMANWQSAICMGTFEELKDSKERTPALEKLLNRNLPHISSQTVKLTSHWPFHSADLSNIPGVVFRIRLNEKSGRYETYEKIAHFAF
jgi:uncharacterized protein